MFHHSAERALREPARYVELKGAAGCSAWAIRSVLLTI